MMGHPRDRRETLTVSAAVNVVFDGLDIGNKLYLIKTSQNLYTFFRTLSAFPYQL
jgi:hypothetical protein